MNEDVLNEFSIIENIFLYFNLRGDTNKTTATQSSSYGSNSVNYENVIELHRVGR